MTDATELLGSVTTHEDFKAAPYKDSKDLWTFGIGRCLETNPLTAAEWKTLLDSGWLSVNITEAGARWLCTRQLAAIEMFLQRYVWFAAAGDVRQNALIEMAFQLGAASFSRFTEMLTAAAAGDWKRAHDEALNSAWARQTPERAAAIANMLLTGRWP